MEKSPEAFRTISEVAGELDVPQHVLRFWESKFSQIRPMKRGGGRRYYRPEDVTLLKGVRHLLYGEGFTIKGVQKILREHGARYVCDAGEGRVRTPDLGLPEEIDEALLRSAQEASNLSREQIQVLKSSLRELDRIRQILKAE